MPSFPQDRIVADNAKVLRLISLYLNLTPDRISPEQLASLTEGFPETEPYAYAALLAAHCGLMPDQDDDDRRLFRKYFIPMIQRLDADFYRADRYLQAIRFPSLCEDGWRFCTQSYRPCEAFVRNDLKRLPDGRILPQIGYFPEEYSFPALLENDREWMTVTPNEINTMMPALASCHGKVLTYGLGLGYFTFHALENPAVTSLTVVERDTRLLDLFRRTLLPQFSNREKLRLICDDAFSYAAVSMPQEHFDVVFTDLWHDPSDGKALWLKMKKTEPTSPGTKFLYWIEETLRCYC